MTHGLCIRHMYNNFKTQFKGLVLKQTLSNAACATTKHRLMVNILVIYILVNILKQVNDCSFQGEIDKMKALNQTAYQWLLSKPSK